MTTMDASCRIRSAGAIYLKGTGSVTQGGKTSRDRRHAPRHLAAFSFWFRPTGGRERFSGWMLNLSNSGAAFLTATEHAPAVGDQVELLPMYSQDRLVREESPALPLVGRVVRLDCDDGTTRRVALHFPAQVPARLLWGRTDNAAVARPISRLPAPLPPPARPSCPERHPAAAGPA